MKLAQFVDETLEPLGLKKLFLEKFKNESDFLLSLKYDNWAFSTAYFFWQLNFQNYPSVGDLVHTARYLKMNINKPLAVKMRNGQIVIYQFDENLNIMSEKMAAEEGDYLQATRDIIQEVYLLNFTYILLQLKNIYSIYKT